MPKKKNTKASTEKASTEEKETKDILGDEPSLGGEEAAIDPAIIEDTFTEEFSEYNDVDNF